MLRQYVAMALMWYVLLASACLLSELQSTFANSTFGHLLLHPKLGACSSPKGEPTPLVPISLGPCDSTDLDRVNGDCKVPMRHDGYLWHRVKEGLWFQATGFLAVEDDEYTALSNRLECDPESLSCGVTVNSVVSVTASKTWEWSSSVSVALTVGIKDILSEEASATAGTSISETSSMTTSAETSYSCTIPGNHTVYLAARIQYYLIFGYVSEYVIVRREFYIDGNGNIRERDYWGWEESCRPMFRIPKVQFDRSVAGTRRCVVEALPDCPSPPSVILV